MDSLGTLPCVLLLIGSVPSQLSTTVPSICRSQAVPGLKFAHAHTPLSLRGRVSVILGIDRLQPRNGSFSNQLLHSSIFAAHSDVIQTLKLMRILCIMEAERMKPSFPEGP